MDANRIRKLVTPSLYIQGKGAIYHLGQKALPFGDKAYVIGGKTALSIAGDRVRKSLDSNGIEVVGWNDTVKECSMEKIDKLVDECRKCKAHFVVGVGGGKAIDTAKMVAWKMKIPAMSVGTQCATNADASAESVIYTEDHRFVEAITLPRNPVLVIEDTEIISKAPVKFLVWGMGDALSVKFEGEAYAKARDKKKDAVVPTMPGLVLADACFKGLMEHGFQAVTDLKNGIHSLHVDDVIEAVKLSSSLAFENTGCALAHALHNGLAKTGQVKGEHGEIVAYTTIVQAAYENRPRDDIIKMIAWCKSVGLPTSIKMLGDPSKSALKQAAEWAADRDVDSRNMPDKMRAGELLEAIERVEAMARLA